MNQHVVRTAKPRPRLLLLVGAVCVVVLTLALWPIGVVLLWLLPVWTRRDKLIGMFVLPGGLLLARVLWTGVRSVCQNAGATLPSAGSGCSSTVIYSLLHPTPSAAFNHMFGSLTVLLAIVLPIVSALYLLVQFARHGRSNLS
jgi:hypothetical protein